LIHSLTLSLFANLNQILDCRRHLSRRRWTRRRSSYCRRYSNFRFLMIEDDW
jgi:hypothetical protein